MRVKNIGTGGPSREKKGGSGEDGKGGSGDDNSFWKWNGYEKGFWFILKKTIKWWTPIG